MDSKSKFDIGNMLSASVSGTYDYFPAGFSLPDWYRPHRGPLALTLSLLRIHGNGSTVLFRLLTGHGVRCCGRDVGGRQERARPH